MSLTITSPALHNYPPRSSHSPCNIILLLRILQTKKPNIAPPVPINPNIIPKTASTGSLGAFLDGREAAAAAPVAVGAGTEICVAPVVVGCASEADGAAPAAGSDDDAGAAAPGLEAGVLTEGEAGGGAGGGALGTAPAPLFSGSTVAADGTADADADAVAVVTTDPCPN